MQMRAGVTFKQASADILRDTVQLTDIFSQPSLKKPKRDRSPHYGKGKGTLPVQKIPTPVLQPTLSTSASTTPTPQPCIPPTAISIMAAHRGTDGAQGSSNTNRDHQWSPRRLAPLLPREAGEIFVLHTKLCSMRTFKIIGNATFAHDQGFDDITAVSTFHTSIMTS